MDPTIISAGIGGLASLAGGLLNTSSQQAINTANIQQQQWAATGGYLPGLVANANAAGISPLVALGQHAPTIGTSVGTQPGAGLEQLGNQLARFDPNAQARADADVALAKQQVVNARLAGTNAAQEIARSGWLNDALQVWYSQHPDAPPPGANPGSLQSIGAGVVGRILGHGASPVPYTSGSTAGSPADLLTRGFRDNFGAAYSPSWLNP